MQVPSPSAPLIRSPQTRIPSHIWPPGGAAGPIVQRIFSRAIDEHMAPLRQRQAQQLGVAVLEAAISLLEGNARSDVSMAEVAQAAGISLRTLYRYFPDRASLVYAAGEHLYRSLGVPFEIAGPEDRDLPARLLLVHASDEFLGFIEAAGTPTHERRD